MNTDLLAMALLVLLVPVSYAFDKYVDLRRQRKQSDKPTDFIDLRKMFNGRDLRNQPDAWRYEKRMRYAKAMVERKRNVAARFGSECRDDLSHAN